MGAVAYRKYVREKMKDMQDRDRVSLIQEALSVATTLELSPEMRMLCEGWLKRMTPAAAAEEAAAAQEIFGRDTDPQERSRRPKPWVFLTYQNDLWMVRDLRPKSYATDLPALIKELQNEFHVRAT